MVFNQALPLTEALDAPRLRVIAAGCTHRLEQHILTHSNYFEEWATMLPRTQIDLFMIGPEMQGPRAVPGTADRSWTQVTERLRYTTSRETLGELLEVRRCIARAPVAQAQTHALLPACSAALPCRPTPAAHLPPAARL